MNIIQFLDMNYEIIDKALKSLDIKENFIIIHSNLLAFFSKKPTISQKKFGEKFLKIIKIKQS